MRTWTDETTGCKMCEPDCADEWLFDIWAIGCDYDGESTVDGLKRLVDSLVEMSQKARDCLHDGKLFPSFSPKAKVRVRHLCSQSDSPLRGQSTFFLLALQATLASVGLANNVDAYRFGALEKRPIRKAV